MRLKTPAQVEADRIDLEMDRLSKRIARFGRSFLRGRDQANVDEVSRKLDGMRGTIRQHMHAEDRKATE